ncbi:MAG TPA: GAF domain-containing sensor histidine kinase, partial [Polyangiaceae bacterium]|nr:GAF domain-containing sensor histidine kinase [Polyangiaceae bacterium]
MGEVEPAWFVGARLAADDASRLIETIRDLSPLTNLDGVMAIVRKAARELSGADGVTFVLREGDAVYYAEENAIGPLWKGRRFPAKACISGWVMMHARPAIIEDIYEDARVPHDAYHPTFVKSLAMVPIRTKDPLGAIGAYWATPHKATEREVTLLTCLAGATAVAMQNAEAYQKSVQATRIRDEFISLASHELKTPLTSLHLRLQRLQRLLEHSPPDEAALGSNLAAALGSSSKLAALVDSLLSVSQLLEGRPMATTTFDLSELTRSVADRLSPQFAAKGVALEVSTPGPLEGSWVYDQIDIVITNLLMNALKYGEGTPVSIRIDEHETAVRVAVKDSGIGVDPIDHERIFHRYERAVRPSSYQGMGLGLWHCREIVSAHGGRLDVHSAVGSG